MLKVSRNAPCPCGSGKKYKHCCMIAKEDPELVFQRTLERAESRLREKLVAFSSGHRFDADVAEAFKLFFNDKYKLGDQSKELPTQAMDRFVDWFIFDYRLKEFGKPTIEVFHESRGYMLDSDEKQLLESWQDTVLSAYSIETVLEGEGLDIVDLLNEDVSFVLSLPAEKQAAAGFNVGDIVVTRVIPIGEKWYPSGTLTRMGADTKHETREFLQKIVADVKAEKPDASIQECLKLKGYLINHMIMDVEERGKAAAASQQAGLIDTAIAPKQEEKQEEKTESAPVE